MNGLSWSALAIILVVCHMTIAAPSPLRVKRQEDELSLDPVNTDDASAKVPADREKRKLDQATFQSKNAVLGFVFGKLDQFIDSKTRFIDQLDKGNIEKNKQLGIETPKPIGSFQELISGIITPKISAITQKFGSLSSGAFAGSSGSSSSGSLGGGHASSSSSDDSGSGGSAGGLSGILSSVLRLSGPILSASLGGGAGASSGSGSSTSDIPADDDDF